jgi:hypothetical protein
LNVRLAIGAEKQSYLRGEQRELGIGGALGMFISKKKYNELVASRDYWRKQAFELANTLDRNVNNLQKIAMILERVYCKGETK